MNNTRRNAIKKVIKSIEELEKMLEAIEAAKE